MCVCWWGVGCTPLLLACGCQRQADICELRSVWTMWRVLGQPELQNMTFYQKQQNLKQTNKPMCSSNLKIYVYTICKPNTHIPSPNFSLILIPEASVTSSSQEIAFLLFCCHYFNDKNLSCHWKARLADVFSILSCSVPFCSTGIRPGKPNTTYSVQWCSVLQMLSRPTVQLHKK